MNQAQYGAIGSFIWNIADDLLRDVYVRGKYRDVILPMTVIRRLDAVLEPTKEAVLRLNEQLDKDKIAHKHGALSAAAKQAFYNTFRYNLRDLRARAKQQQLKADFEAYLDGFSPNVQEILDKFKFRNQSVTLVEADILGGLIEKFTSNDINLGPKPVYDQDGNIRLPGLDNHAMGTIFEELVRRFNEENNEEAGEHWTPRDVVRLMAQLIFVPIADDIRDATYRVYDGACGTGGMLTVAEETLQDLAKQHDKDVSIHLFGQEINPETYAICKADMLLKGEGQAAENVKYGSTLSSDGFLTMEFDFMLSNPPYGKSWKTDLERMGGKGDLQDHRFTVQHKGEELSLITRSSDGQLIFLVNKLSKMVPATGRRSLGSRIAEVHNGSSLFTGDAGQGESNIRRWIIENDWLEAIIALPLNMFYNTGIATYIWVLTNRKPDRRKGKVQLIDVTGLYHPGPARTLGKLGWRGKGFSGRIVSCDMLLHERILYAGDRCSGSGQPAAVLR
jgi:type I restriction enzyme M protein